MPVKAVEWCLKSAGLTLDDIDHIGFYMDWRKRLWKRLKYRSGCLIHSPRYSLAYILYEFAHNAEYLYGAYRLKGKKTRLHFLEHHSMHGCSAFFASPFEEAALLSIDYIGEFASTWFGVGQGKEIKTLREIHFPQSLGVFYSALTDYLGFLRASDEYKVMGLASYGDPDRYIAQFRKIISTPVEGEYFIDLDYFQFQYLPGSRLGYMSKKFQEEFGPPRKKGESIEQRHQDLAAAGQKILEETVLHLCNHLYQSSGRKKQLCIAGGVGLNCSMNGKLLGQSPFDEIYVQPAAGDDGIALGICYHLYHQVMGMERFYEPESPPAEPTQDDISIPSSRDFLEIKDEEIQEENDTSIIEEPPIVEPIKPEPRMMGLSHVYLGPSYDSETVEHTLKISKLRYEKLENPARTGAEWIAKGSIVGWFQGAMEFGPRALGSRSILADPTRPDMKDILNQWVKHREDFRPFAPSICEENFHEYFIHPEVQLTGQNEKAEYPYMLFVFPVRPEMQEKIPAVTHIDGTARVQTVSAKANPLYYQLIREFEKLKGVPVVLNTSYNVMGEPIVCSPTDALRCFFTTGIDVLIIGDFLVQK